MLFYPMNYRNKETMKRKLSLRENIAMGKFPEVGIGVLAGNPRGFSLLNFD